MGKALDLLQHALRRPLMVPLRALLRSHGRQSRLDLFGSYAYPNTHVGDYSSLGYRPILVVRNN